jgi:hypothetical protein
VTPTPLPRVMKKDAGLSKFSFTFIYYFILAVLS